MKYYCWLNIQTGEFSNSWTEEEHKKFLTDKDIDEYYETHPEWKLISYECVNDRNLVLLKNSDISAWLLKKLQ